jgi:NAD(P)-dependent dehydrogenase (short-subunit alcohol dehydrogenase family)
MSETVASQLLRARLLQGVGVLVAGPEDPRGEHSLGAAVAAACGDLGAAVSRFELALDDPSAGEDRDAEDGTGSVPAETEGLELLVVDGAALFATGAAGRGQAGEDRGAALRDCLDGAWSATRAVVNEAFLPRGEGGRIVYLAPASSAGEHADAARAGLENLARTLSVEWARHAITVVAIAPGEATTAGEVGALVAYLASPAGAYFSGCLLDLTG